MELSKICEKIIDDAKVQAAGIREEATRKSIELINAADLKNSEKAGKLSANAPAVAKETYDKLISDTSLNAKKEILAGKRALINAVFADALKKLENLSAGEYKALLSEKSKAVAEKAEVEIDAKYDKDITDEYLKSLNPLLTKSKNSALSGFNFVMENSRLNYNFSEAVSHIAEEKDSAVASILFS